ncbi:hypothetical protein [Halococcus sediminicola]|uniref:hypothetical protein n=1 Tax=Halococcus sediminicola TaxID=1264579 RepID=UPI0012ABEE93|nr:hypothetical protein [Halococcus sediminicola]
MNPAHFVRADILRKPYSTAEALGARSLRSLLASLAHLALHPPGAATAATQPPPAGGSAGKQIQQ